jgi:hypothetical protein
MQTRKYKSYDGFVRATQVPYIDAHTVQIGRYKRGEIGVKCKLDSATEDNFWHGIATTIWRKPTESQVNRLKCCTAWFMERLIWNGRCFSYIAGQDYVAEMRDIKRTINRM